MTGDVPEESEVFQFILDRIDSVPHLEALLLLWNSRPTKWSSKELVARLYVETEVARKLLVDLSRGQPSLPPRVHLINIGTKVDSRRQTGLLRLSMPFTVRKSFEFPL
jgi:hypothetical protein